MLVQKQFVSFGHAGDGLTLDSGQILEPVTVAYETFGALNSARDNAVMICHAFSGDSHVAGRYSLKDNKPGWWDVMVGSGKPFDTDRYFVICSNVLGGCKGTTGPGSINPAAGREYALDFPVITIGDMVRSQLRLLDHLGIRKLYCVAGGSMGGMQALVWALEHGERVASAMLIATAAYTSTQCIAFNKVGRNAIMSDPDWNQGQYYGNKGPERGLAIARMIGHITYLSDESMRSKFSRRLQASDRLGFQISDEFAVESYLEHQGESFAERFDANSYLYITKAMDYFDIPAQYGSLEKAFAHVSSRFLVVSFTSDWLYPGYQSREIVKALMWNRKDVSYCEIKSPGGHDAFLLEADKLGRIISSFLMPRSGER